MLAYFKPLDDETSLALTRPITTHELSHAVKELRPRVATGVFGLNATVIKTICMHDTI